MNTAVMTREGKDAALRGLIALLEEELEAQEEIVLLASRRIDRLEGALALLEAEGAAAGPIRVHDGTEDGLPEPGGDPITIQIRGGPGLRRPQAETEAIVRDWARERDDWFRAKELARALGYAGGPSLLKILRALVERGTLETNGRPRNSPAYRYRFVRPTNGTELKAEPEHRSRRERAQVAGGGQGIAGTGQARKVTTTKDLVSVIARARARGWRLEVGKGHHDLLVHPNGQRTAIPRSSSDRHAAATLEGELKRKEAAGSPYGG